MRLALLVFILSCWILLPVRGAHAQSRAVSGKVTTLTAEPVQGITVSLRGSPVKSITDDEGAYRIEVPGNSGILIFSAVGFETQELAIPESNELNVVLTEIQTNLDEVVVVGYGTQSRRTIKIGRAHV